MMATISGIMSTNDSQWKSFYRNQYANQWQTFARELGEKPYHVRYQGQCLEPLQALEGKRVLEVGVGRGDLLSRFVPDTNMRFGCDLSAGNIQASQQRFAEESRSVFLSHADAETLPFADASFDAVYSLSVLFYVPNWPHAVAEMFRVAKPGGLVLFDMLNALHVTSMANHTWRIACRMMGRELGRTTLATPASLLAAARPHACSLRCTGNYILLPAGLPVLKEAGNWCQFVPALAYANTESPARWLAHKILIQATRSHD